MNEKNSNNSQECGVMQLRTLGIFVFQFTCQIQPVTLSVINLYWNTAGQLFMNCLGLLLHYKGTTVEWQKR